MNPSLTTEAQASLEALAAARNRKQGLEALEGLLQLALDPEHWTDFEILLATDDYDERRVSKRLYWRLKTHLVESLAQWAPMEMIDRLFEQLLASVTDDTPDELRSTFHHFTEAVCRQARPEAIQFARTALEHGGRVRERAIKGVRMASYVEEIDPAFAAAAAEILAEAMTTAPSDEKQSMLGAIHVFSLETWLGLIGGAQPAEPPDWEEDRYVIRGASGQWGDYGSILFHGMMDRQGQLERTGPYVPPVTAPGYNTIVVTESCRRKLESRGIDGLVFVPVVLTKLVLIKWHEWDRAYPQPKRYPPQGEPENYILGRKDRPALRDKVGRLWRLTQNGVADDEPALVSRELAQALFEIAGEWITIEPN